MTNHPNRSRKHAVETLILDARRVKVRESWHAALPGEPPCGDDEWRQRDRRSVIKIASMETSHLIHCIRFASMKKHHRSKLPALQLELGKRQTWLRGRIDFGPTASEET